MTEKHVSVANVKARFAEVLDGVLHRGERYVVERHGRGVAAIVSIADLQRLEPGVPERALGAMAIVGLLHDVPDEAIDALLAEVRESRGHDTGRRVKLTS